LAKIIGVGNGNPGSHEPDHAACRRAFHGFCQVILQASDEPGQVALTGTAPGLLQDQVILENVEWVADV
jgi:beta-galactosidase